jgi:uncharacterized damage-inducible protein DinB
MTALLEGLLPEFDQEMALTRCVLERAPEAQFDWRPDEKSFSLGGLATHLAVLPRWGRAILTRDRHDLAGGTTSRPALPTVAAVLEMFDGHVADTRGELGGMTDALLMARWSLSRGDAVLMSMPRVTAFRRFLLYHVVHHRGQFTVYLRHHQIPIPPMYGPSADESL